MHLLFWHKWKTSVYSLIEKRLENLKEINPKCIYCLIKSYKDNLLHYMLFESVTNDYKVFERWNKRKLSEFENDCLIKKIKLL